MNSSDDVLSCPKCGERTMLVYIEKNDAQTVKCASCLSLVAYTSNLIRVLDYKPPS